jgi:hypothetical protein
VIDEGIPQMIKNKTEAFLIAEDLHLGKAAGNSWQRKAAFLFL